METLVWTRGRAFPPSRLESRLRCPRCGSPYVVVLYEPPRNVAAPINSIRIGRVLRFRKPALVGAHASSENGQCFPGDDMIVAVHDCNGRRNLRFGDGGDLFHHHAVQFVLPASIARREPQHAKRDNALRFDTKLKRLQRQRQPRDFRD